MTPGQLSFFTTGTAPRAEFSACQRYRYTLHRRWELGSGVVLFVMLNPSTATDLLDDPTIRKCCGFAQRWGHAGIDVANLFAFRSTDPFALYGAIPGGPEGPDNDSHIARLVSSADLVVAAWGAHGRLHGRGNSVLATVRKLGKEPHAFKLNSDGTPTHPLYQPYELKPRVVAELEAERA